MSDGELDLGNRLSAGGNRKLENCPARNDRLMVLLLGLVPISRSSLNYCLPSSNEDSVADGSSLGGLRRSFVTSPW